MAWNTVIPTMVRHLIGDLGNVQVYSDDRLSQAVAVAAVLTQQEHGFDTDYTVDVEEPDITPDPTLAESLDNAAVALFALKAACILTTNNYQSAVKNGVRVSDWNSTVDTSVRFQGYRDILTFGPCASYSKMLDTINWDQKAGKGKAVFGPYIYQQNNNSGVWDVRRFFDCWGY